MCITITATPAEYTFPGTLLSPNKPKDKLLISLINQNTLRNRTIRHGFLLII